MKRIEKIVSGVLKVAGVCLPLALLGPGAAFGQAGFNRAVTQRQFTTYTNEASSALLAEAIFRAMSDSYLDTRANVASNAIQSLEGRVDTIEGWDWVSAADTNGWNVAAFEDWLLSSETNGWNVAAFEDWLLASETNGWQVGDTYKLHASDDDEVYASLEGGKVSVYHEADYPTYIVTNYVGASSLDGLVYSFWKVAGGNTYYTNTLGTSNPLIYDPSVPQWFVTADSTIFIDTVSAETGENLDSFVKAFGNSTSIGFTYVDPVSKLSTLATETYVDAAVAEIPVPDLSAYAPLAGAEFTGGTKLEAARIGGTTQLAGLYAPFEVHLINDNHAWTAAFYNDVYSADQPTFTYYGYNNGDFAQGTEVDSDLIFYTDGYMNERLKLDRNGHLWLMGDSAYLYFGAGKDAGITYTGVDMIINPKVVGTGKLDVTGVLQTDGYNAADGSAGLTATVTVVTDTRDNAGQMQKKTQVLTFKNGLLTAQAAESAWTDTTDP